jgi:acetyltransferase
MGPSSFRWPRPQTTSDGKSFVIRPATAADLERQRAFVRGLSAESRYLRFLHAAREPDERWLRAPDEGWDRALTLLATCAAGDGEAVIGMASYAADARGECEFAVAVADEWQCRGIGTTLVSVLFECAERAGVRVIYGHILAGNPRMIELAEWLGMRVDPPAAGGDTVRAWRQFR